MHIHICSATPFEYAGLVKRWPAGAYAGALHLSYQVSGVGPVHTGVHLSLSEEARACDLILNIGVAGAIDLELTLGEVVHVVREEFGDLGVEERDGTFTSAMRMGLVDGGEAPYRHGYLYPPQDTAAGEAGKSFPAFAKTVTAVTNATVHGSADRIAALRDRTDAQIETMEGASVFYVAHVLSKPVVQLRAISNYVEPRNRDAWRLELALTNLTEAADQMLSALPGAAEARSARLQLGL